MFCKESRKSLKKRFEKALDLIWKSGDPLPEDPEPKLPKAPLSKDQLDATRDPLDILIEREGK